MEYCSCSSGECVSLCVVCVDLVSMQVDSCKLEYVRTYVGSCTYHIFNFVCCECYAGACVSWKCDCHGD